MANPYDPGHPVMFWLAILALAGGIYTGGRAFITYQECSDKGLAQKWEWTPPRWECVGPQYR